MKKKCCGKYALKGERATESALDRQVGSTQHYKDFKIQPIEFITANKLSFIQGNVIKYICRYDKKNGKEDILKAIQNLEFILERDYD